MAINLTEDAIEMLSTGKGQGPQGGVDIQPVLQVTDIRLVNTQNHQNNSNTNNERYRILLSDGKYLQQGMLATQRNELVRSQKLQKGSIVQLTQFVCNLIQNRMIIIIIDLEVLLEKCDTIGEPKQFPLKTDGDNNSAARSSVSAPVQPSLNHQPAPVTSTSQSLGGGGGAAAAAAVGIGPASRPNMGIESRGQAHIVDHSSHPYGGSVGSNLGPGRYGAANTAPAYSRPESGSGISQPPMTNYVRPPQPAYQQPTPVFTNRGPIARNESAPRIVPIAALNPYQGRWTIKARVTAKGELRHYSNPRGDGRVFSFDLLDANGGEIRVTCFNSVADQFYNQIETGKVYMISKGSLRPAQRNFSHLPNDHEILLETTSVVQPCFEDDRSIPQQQFHFRPISDIEGLENNAFIDLIGVVSSISPTSSIMRRNGTETLRRILQLKDMSGRSVELTLWGSFCNAEGLKLQTMCDSGIFPVLAVKAGKVSEFNGKAVGTINTSQLFIEPDFPEARELKTWFERDGRNTTSVSISRDATGYTRTDVRKTISQIKDEKLGTSEKPDWITVIATLSFIKAENFCYSACPLKIGERQCSKKVTNNGDGKWRCDRCDKTIDECDYRYILQLQIQDHTGLTWVTAFQESGEEILGISAKDLYYMKYEEGDEDQFADIVRSAIFNKYVFKLKVKEETFSDEQRVKATVVKAEKINFESETKLLLEAISKLKGEDPGSLPLKTDYVGLGSGVIGSRAASGIREPAVSVPNYSGNTGNSGREIPSNQVGSYGNSYGGSRITTSSTGVNCNSCGGMGHISANCPTMVGQGQTYGGGPTTVGHGHAYGGGFNNRSSGASTGGASGECFKCHQSGHWARDCPNMINAPPAYGNNSVTPGRYGNAPRQHVGGF